MAHEKRSSYRYRLGDGQTGELLDGPAEIPCQIVNQSSTGFSVEAKSRHAFYEGQQLVLRLGSEELETEVTRVAAEEGGKLQLGLKFLEAQQPSASHKSSRIRLQPMHSGGPLRQVASFLIYVTLGATIAYFVSENSTSRAGADTSEINAFHGGLDGEHSVRLGGVSALMAPSVVAQLHLSKEQQRSINRILAQTATLLIDMAADNQASPSTDWTQQTSEVVERSLQRVLFTLDEEQLQRWHVMVQKDLELRRSMER